jgi:hypothetical protein
MITAINFLKRDESGIYNEQDMMYMMIEFAKMHAVEILKKLSKTEMEYQRNIQYIYILYQILNK